MITLDTVFSNGFMATESDVFKHCDGTPVTYAEMYLSGLEGAEHEGETRPYCENNLPQPFNTKVRFMFVPEKGGLTPPYNPSV